MSLGGSSRAPFWLALTMSLVALAACGKSGGGAQPQREQPPALVEVAPVREGTLRDEWTFLGDVRAQNRAELAAGASGAVTTVRVREGDRVAAGDLLLEVDPALALARVEVAAAAEALAAEQLEQARRDVQRVERIGAGLLAEAEIERARSLVKTQAAQLEMRRASAAEARAEYARHRIKAPFAGVVAGRRVDPGAWVSPGQPVLELVSLGDVEVLVSASADIVGAVKEKDEATLHGREDVPAEVVGIVPALDPVARTVRVRLRPREVPAWLLAGSAVRVTFAINLSGRGVVVPRDALVTGPVDTKVMRVEKGTAQPIDVIVVATAAADALVVGDRLLVGDQVVVRGNERVRPGQPVRTME